MKKIILMFTAIFGLALSISLAAPSQANASSWHKGTPKVLRGTYESHEKYSKSHQYGTRMYIRPDATPFYAYNLKKGHHNDTSSMQGIAELAKYKKVGKNTYKLVGEYKFKGGKATMYLKSYSHHKIRFTFTSSFSGQPYLTRYKTSYSFF